MTEPVPPHRILVLDGACRAAVEAVQSLGKRGLEVHVASRTPCPAFHSRWTRKRIDEPSTGDWQVFVNWLRGLADDYTLIIPSTEYSLYFLSHLPASDPLRAKCGMPSPDALRGALDKGQTADIGRRLGIGVPATSRPATSADAATDPLPRVLKPIHSLVSHNGQLVQLSPVLVRDAEQRKEALERLLDQCSVLEQELVPGIGIGIECLYSHGTLVWYFAHERLHEGSPTGLGSGSSYRKSIAAPPALLAAAKSLLDELRWHGVAMVEFKHDPASGRSWLMEINPRLWGSVALAIDAGVDFPYGMYCLAIGRDPGPQPAYATPYYTRLVPHDADWLRRALKTTTHGLRELTAFTRVLTGRESWDHFAWTDPAPLWSTGAEYFREKRAALARRRAVAADAQTALELHAANVPRLKAVRANRLLFICTGNICRSPLAEALWQAAHPQRPVSSAGFIKREGRTSPENIRVAAAARGATLTAHRSRTVTDAMLREADIVVLFEPRNFTDLRAQFPQHLGKVVMLGALLSPPRASINDPYQLSTAETEHIATEVDAGLRELATLLDSQPRA